MCEPEGFSLRDLAAFTQAVRTYDSFGKSIETVGRLAGESVNLEGVGRRLRATSIDFDVAALKFRVAWWQVLGLPDD